MKLLPILVSLWSVLLGPLGRWPDISGTAQAWIQYSSRRYLELGICIVAWMLGMSKGTGLQEISNLWIFFGSFVRKNTVLQGFWKMLCSWVTHSECLIATACCLSGSVFLTHQCCIVIYSSLAFSAISSCTAASPKLDAFFPSSSYHHFRHFLVSNSFPYYEYKLIYIYIYI